MTDRDVIRPEGGVPPTAMVTGGSGFLGGYVTRALLDGGWRVHVFDLQEPSPEIRWIVGGAGGHASFTSGSVTDWATVIDVVRAIRPQAIVHLAAAMGTHRLSRNPFMALEVNVGGTLNVLEAARQFSVDRTVVFSSLGALAPRQYEPIDASHPTMSAREASGTGFYGASKLAAEAFSFAYASAYGLDVRIIRPSMAYGFGMPTDRATSDVKLLVEGACEARPVRVEAGASVRRGFTHAADVASLAVALLRGPKDCDRLFYAATGAPLPQMADVVAILKELIPGANLSIGDSLTEEQIVESRYRGQLDISNARDQLAWTPEYADLRSGLGQYVSDYRSFRKSLRSGDDAHAAAVIA